ncbi:MAG: sensor histidine kinase [Micrococcales bacterium]|nr:sensor histidine kinase [Micrococcales bacterium]
MPTLSALSQRYGPLPPADLEWLQLLTGDWQVLSDLAFADLVLWLPSEGGFVAIAQCRPSTGSTVYDDDVVGSVASPRQCAQLQAALDERRPLRLRSSWGPSTATAPWPSTSVVWSAPDRQPHWYGDFAVREEVVPVVHDGRPVAVMSRHANVGGARTPSRLELNYVEAADDMVGMVARGEYPLPVSRAGSGSPRVGDGMMRVDAEATVLYVSPNALSCLHRLGVQDDPVGRSLVDISAALVGLEVGKAPPMLSKAPWWVDVESHGVTVAVRGLPLTEDGDLTGAVLLCRDVSELRRRERELVTKDATIREIHHRVKNNLQTVAALLRMQSRRVTSSDARAALTEAMRRVATIALVHEALSQNPDETVDFDDVVRLVLRLTADAAACENQVSTVLEGTFGHLCAKGATALALVLTELVTNAVEHGFADGGSGTVRVVVDRDDDQLQVEVVDDGRGLTDGPGDGLGTQIVSTLVANELGGSIVWRSGPQGGTSVVIQMQVCLSRDEPVG